MVVLKKRESHFCRTNVNGTTAKGWRVAGGGLPENSTQPQASLGATRQGNRGEEAGGGARVVVGSSSHQQMGGCLIDNISLEACAPLCLSLAAVVETPIVLVASWLNDVSRKKVISLTRKGDSHS